MAGGETLQPAASREALRELRESIYWDLTDELGNLFRHHPGARSDEVVTSVLSAWVHGDLARWLPVVLVRLADSPNPDRVLIHDIQTAGHDYRLSLVSDDRTVGYCDFNMQANNTSTLIKQGAFESRPQISLGDLDGEREGVLLVAEDPHNKGKFKLGQLVMESKYDWRPALQAEQKAEAALQADSRTQEATTAPVDSGVAASSTAETRQELRNKFVDELKAGLTRAGETSSLRPSGDVFSGSRYSSEDHGLGRHDSPPRHYTYEDAERDRYQSRGSEVESRRYIGATPVVSEEDSPYAPVKYVRDKGGKWVPEDPENRRRGERQSRRGRSNPLGGMTVATPQTFTRIAEQPRRESASVPAEKTSGAKTGEQKRPEGRFKKKANKKPKKQLEKEEKQSKGGKK